ncbi:MAG: ATP-binding cassette domain-containing protein [Clostridium sp.]
MIEIKIAEKYGKKVALKVFLVFEDGIYGMLGANGAGKSTLMNLLTDNVKGFQVNFDDGKEILKMGKLSGKSRIYATAAGIL